MMIMPSRMHVLFPLFIAICIILTSTSCADNHTKSNPEMETPASLEEDVELKLSTVWGIQRIYTIPPIRYF